MTGSHYVSYIVSVSMFGLGQDADMWQDAMRVCKEYSPHKLQELQDEYEREVLTKRGGAGGGGLGLLLLSLRTLTRYSFCSM